MFDLKITKTAKEFIEKKGGSVYIKNHDIINSCIEANFKPEIVFGIPKNVNKYYLLNIESINIYINKSICQIECLTIDLKKFLGIKYLVINGWKIF